jgi:uncharacterized membrane protein
MNRNDVNRKTWYLLILMPIIYLAVSVLVVFLVKNNGAYPTGSDTMYHIFRGDYVYNSIKEGSWYPIYNSMWYNGVEIMRYWAPLTAYYMALCQMIAGGGQLAGYLIFVGSVCFFNSILWLIISSSAASSSLSRVPVYLLSCESLTTTVSLPSSSHLSNI